MTHNHYTIRAMHPDEVDIAIEWAAGEGWNPGLHDAQLYSKADPDGFFIGLRGSEPVATISVIRYSDSFGFLGFYIVKPEYRGQGYGIRIWQAGLAYLQGCTIGLDGVVAQQENYTKSGFTLAYRNIRFQGTGGGTPPENEAIVDLKTLPLETITTFDGPFFPAPRPGFLASWINQPGAVAQGIMRHDKIAGYGVIRKCRLGRKIGPLYADDPQMADLLFRSLQSTAGSDEPVFLDIPEVNANAVALVKRYHMQAMFETARMYRGKTPVMPLERVYGVTSFEIG